MHRFRIGGVPEHFNLPWHLANESGRFSSSGVRLDWIDYPNGTGAMLADLELARLDGAVLLTEGAALGMARKLPISAISLYTTTPLIWGVHVPPTLEVESLADLEGRRFAISRPGSGSHLMSFALARQQGWSKDALEFEIVDDLPGAVEALNAGRAEVFLWEHFTTAPWVKDGVFRRIDDFVSPWPAWTICTTSKLADDARGAFQSMIAVVADEALRLKASAEGAQRIASRYDLALPDVLAWLARTHWVEAVTSPDVALAAAESTLRAAGAL